MEIITKSEAEAYVKEYLGIKDDLLNYSPFAEPMNGKVKAYYSSHLISFIFSKDKIDELFSGSPANALRIYYGAHSDGMPTLVLIPCLVSYGDTTQQASSSQEQTGDSEQQSSEETQPGATGQQQGSEAQEQASATPTVQNVLSRGGGQWPSPTTGISKATRDYFDLDDDPINYTGESYTAE